ncbi:hypothetical protein [Syntrophomonas palmitatica]|uniref:hypothetical protein n=1 Tax=Syntrophomonas palmitatica TaxID=402877 RepID=UPI0006D1CBD6|nr:hypothetical protein [Syntrophomonas palmitatica]
MKNELLKYLIIVTLVYYLLKGLIYLLLWQTTKRVEQRALEAKRKEKEKRDIANQIWEDEDK